MCKLYMSLIHIAVLCLLHDLHLLEAIYGEGAMRTAGVMVIQFGCQNQFELKGEGGATLGGMAEPTLNKCFPDMCRCLVGATL